MRAQHKLQQSVPACHGQAVTGRLCLRTGSAWGWRWPFVLVALPALGVAAIMLVTTREPPRGGTEAALSVRSCRARTPCCVQRPCARGDASAAGLPCSAGRLARRAVQQPGSLVLTRGSCCAQKAYASGDFQYSERISLRKAAGLARTRSNLAVVLQGLPGSLPWGVLITFLNDFLSQQKGLTVPQATLVRRPLPPGIRFSRCPLCSGGSGGCVQAVGTRPAHNCWSLRFMKWAVLACLPVSRWCRACKESETTNECATGAAATADTGRPYPWVATLAVSYVKASVWSHMLVRV